MEGNKENVDRVKTRIPLPLKPLPALPNHLLVAKTVAKGNKRLPLSTLMESNSVPRSNGASFIKKEPLRINTRYVTLRPRHDSLDWDYKALKDGERETTINIDDESVANNNGEDKFFDRNVDRNCLESGTSTPKGSLEHKGLRNIKKSLKRPHSRELQGLSPAPNKEKKIDEKAKRRLMFNEGLEARLRAPDFWHKSYMQCLVRDYSDDMFHYLTTAEKKPLGVPKMASITRSCIINWLIKVNGSEGNPAVIQSACWYLDSILAISSLQLKRLQLVAAACYWIAQKLHGPNVSSMKLIRCSNNAFTAGKLLLAEKTILQTLSFPTQPVVPQEFIPYLSWWCDKEQPGEIEVAATFLCLSGQMIDKELCEEYPSVIAAACVSNALLLLGKHKLMAQLQLCPLYKVAEKKTTRMSYICSVVRKAVRTISAVVYEYKAPFEHYNAHPYYIAQRIINAANELSVLDTSHNSRESVSFKY